MYFVADPEYIILKYDQIRFVKLRQKKQTPFFTTVELWLLQNAKLW